MRRFAYILVFAFLSGASLAHALEGCGADMSRIGFKDKAGKDYEVWKCDGGWRLSNLANEQAYVNGDGKPCVKNASTGQEFCCPQAPTGNKTDTRGKVESSKDSQWSCVGPKGVANPTADQKDTLLIAPLNTNGSFGSTVYRISGGNDSKDKDIKAKDKKSRLNIDIEVPENTPGDNNGSISLESPMGSGGGGDNKCATKDDGSFCQLPKDITKHNYESTENSKYVMQDTPSGGQSKAVQTDTTGKTAFSAH